MSNRIDKSKRSYNYAGDPNPNSEYQWLIRKADEMLQIKNKQFDEKLNRLNRIKRIHRKKMMERKLAEQIFERDAETSEIID